MTTLSLRASSQKSGKTSRVRMHDHLAWLLATPANGELAHRLGTYRRHIEKREDPEDEVGESKNQELKNQNKWMAKQTGRWLNIQP